MRVICTVAGTNGSEEEGEEELCSEESEAAEERPELPSRPPLSFLSRVSAKAAAENAQTQNTIVSKIVMYLFAL
jgi:hypothetical protein